MRHVLESGIYEIRNHGTGNLVYRRSAEDRSAAPKAVYSLPLQARPDGHWKVEKKSNGLYVLKARNEATGPYSPSAEGQKHVHAFLGGRPIDRQGPIEWAIAEVQSTQNRKGYIVETVLSNGDPVGWIAADYQTGDRGIPISLGPLSTHYSNPPKFPPREVFEFTPIYLRETDGDDFEDQE